MQYATLKDRQLHRERVLIRVDFNVPLDSHQNIIDDKRIQASVPTIQYCLDQGASVVLMSHLGRPKGKAEERYSLLPCAKRLSELLGQPVRFVRDLEHPHPLQPKEVVLLENLRFYPAEEHPTQHPEFTKTLRKWGDVYVNDAFATMHRKHASTYYLPALFTHPVMGLLVEKELQALEPFVNEPKTPFYAILGGNKISSKIGLISTLLDKVDKVFIGGGMAFTFLKAKGFSVGNSLLDTADLPIAKETLQKAQEKGTQIFLPEDVVVTEVIKADSPYRTVAVDQIGPQDRGVDIGPKTCETWEQEMRDAKQIFWNGPLGVYEIPAFQKGTLAVAKILANSSAVTMVGGGDSAAAIKDLQVENSITHVCTGGGASLEYLETGDLVALETLEKN